MAKNKMLPIHVVENSANSKLSVRGSGFNVITTYAEVGPTCPRKCWFHPTGEYLEQAKALGLKPCYTKKGPTNFLVSAKAFQEADYTQLGIDGVAEVFNRILTMHKYHRKHVDLIRWQTGGDILHPWTGQVWDEFVDLILDVAAISKPLGIPTIGFTATWREPGAQRLRRFFHASVQNEADARQASEMGWTVAYAVLKQDVPAGMKFLRSLSTEIKALPCPEQTGKADSCANCGACCYGDFTIVSPHPIEPSYMKYRRMLDSYLVPINLLLIQHN